MSVNLLALLKDQVTGSLAKEASSFLGEDTSAVTSALGSAFPSILGGLIEQGSNPSGASKIMDLVKGVDPSMLGNIGGLFGGGASSVNGLLNSGGGIVDMIFGDKMGGVVSLISKMSGLKDSSTSSLLKMAAPFLMGMIGKKMSGGGASGLMDLLMGQKEHVKAAMPKGLGNILGLGALGDLGNSALSAAKGGMDTVGNTGKAAAGMVGNAGKAAAGTATAAASTGMGWLKWALPILLLAGAAYFLLGKGCAGDMKDATSSVVDGTKDMANKAADATKNAAGTVSDATKDAANAVGGAVSGAFSKVDEAAKAALDKISFAAGSVGSEMKEFIDGGFEGENSFTFNNLTFASGSAAIAGESGIEVDNLAAILKAYPGVNIEVHGYTDNTGDAAKNVALSLARAEAVKARLIAQGIAANRIDAAGHGDADAIGDNNTEEGRAQNRRIEVKIKG